MAGKLTRSAYEKLIAEDIDWMKTIPRTLERDHIIEVLKISPKREYDDQNALESIAGFYEFLISTGEVGVACKLVDFLGYVPERRKMIPA